MVAAVRETPAQPVTAALWLGRVLLAGAVCGIVIGGVGGRLAMFVLRLTSSDHLRGAETDDGFTVGEFSGATVFLVGAGAVLGMGGAFVYVLARQWLPTWSRVPTFALIGATVGGAAFIRTDGLDFTLLEPLELAVAMFIILPAAYGAAMVWLSERWLRSTWWDRHRWGWLTFLPLLAALVVSVTGFAVTLVVLLAMTLVPLYPPVLAMWRSPAVAWLGRAGIAALVLVAGSRLVDDVTTIL